MNFERQEMKTCHFFVVPISNEQITEKIELHLASPVLKYQAWEDLDN